MMRDELLAALCERVRDFSVDQDPALVLADDATATAQALRLLAVQEGHQADERFLKRIASPGRPRPVWVDPDALATLGLFHVECSMAQEDGALSDEHWNTAMEVFGLLHPAHRRWIPPEFGEAFTPRMPPDPLNDPADQIDDLGAAIGLLTEACARPEPHLGWRSQRRIALADAHGRRFETAGEHADLVAAEACYAEAVSCAFPGTETYLRAATGLGTAQGRLGAATAGAAGDAALQEAARWLRIAADQSLTASGRRVRLGALAATMCVRLARLPQAGDLPRASPEPAACTGPEDSELRRQSEALADLARKASTRILTEAEAVALACEQSTELSQAAVESLLEAALRLVRDGKARDALPAISIAMEAARVRWGAGLETVWFRAADLYVEAARFALGDAPDPALYARACELADEQIRLLSQRGTRGLRRNETGEPPPDDDSAELGQTLFAAGLLRYTPYTGQTAGLSFESAQTLWREGQRTIATAVPDEAQMPDPLTSFQAALPYLRDAAGLAAGHERARVLKSLAEVLCVIAWLRRESNDTQIRALAREAFDLLDPLRDPGTHLYLLRLLCHFGEVLLPAGLSGLLPIPLAAVRDRDGALEAASVFADALSLAEEAGRPDLEGLLIKSADRDLPELSSDAGRRRRWSSEVHILDQNRLACSEWPAEARSAAAALRAQMEQDSWPAGARAATLIHAAAHALASGEAVLGLELIAQASGIAPELWHQDDRALAYLSGRLAFAVGESYRDEGHPDLATGQFADALGAYAACQETALALGSLDAGLACAVAVTGPDAARITASLLAGAALSLRASTSEVIGWRLYNFYQVLALEFVSSAGASHDFVGLLHQAAKGMDFTIAQGHAGPLALSARLVQLIERVRVAETRLARPVAEPEMVGDEFALLSYIGRDEAEPGAGPDVETRNQQRAADRWISMELLPSHAADRRAFVFLDDLQRLLPAETVLLSLFFGRYRTDSGAQELCLHGLAVTRERTEHRTLRLGSYDPGLVKAVKDEHAIIFHPVGAEAAALRRAVVSDPMNRPVSREALPLLADEPDSPGLYLAGFGDALARWRAQGKTHLCIWPDGPLHYVPFHLLGTGAKLVADDWTVSTLPGLGFLRAGEHPAGRGLIVFASAAGGLRHGLHREDALESHAVGVAAAMSTTATVGADATPRRFLAALAGARYVHVAAHGTHIEWAPWYQCLYLSPEGDGDGRVFAHDILRMDLRGVDLVTMSSCESALGRFDVNDNLRGLPAAFLAAGTSAVIGCLWPVHPDVATFFFRTLYERLAADADRRAAFRTAQLATRAIYRAYRDWGAFSFLGDWRTSQTAEGVMP